MTNEEIRNALAKPTKASRKALARIALEMETNEPDRYGEILAKTDWQGEAADAYASYRRTKGYTRIAMTFAVLVVIGSYLVGDFGMQLLTGWLNRYALATGVLVAVGLLTGGGLLLNSRKERLIAYGILEGL